MEAASFLPHCEANIKLTLLRLLTSNDLPLFLVFYLFKNIRTMTNIYRLSLGLCLLCVLSVFSLRAQDKTKAIDSLVTAYTKMGKFSGTVLVTQDGKTLFEKGYGYKNTAKKTKNDANTIYQIGSVTKTFTSTLIMMLQEQGKLNVKDKLSKYMPGFPDGDQITIEQLLNHTSGVYNYTQDTSFEKEGMLKHQSRQDMIALFKDKMPANLPGAKFNYSNSNYMLLGYIVEDLTGKTWYQALRDMIFTPLGMKNSGANFKGLNSPNKATGYFAIDGDQGMAAPFVDSSVSYAAGAIYTTAGDLDKWAQAVVNQQLLRPVDWMQATKAGMESYGYGWMIGDMYGKRSVGHNGGVHGFLSNMFIVPEDKLTIITLSNNMNSELGAIRREISAILYDKPFEVPVVKPEVKLPVATLNQYVGNYELAPGFDMKISLDGTKLMGQLTGQNAFQLFAEQKDMFFLKVVDAQVNFVRDANNKVTQLMLKQNGRILPGKKK